jgi:cobalt/nickel transport system permease protein
MFGHGGLTTLGVNGIILGLPALLAAGLFRLYDRKARASVRGIVVRGGLAASAATALSVLLFVGFVALAMPAQLDGTAERSALLVLMLAHIPLVVLEGVVTGVLVLVLVRSAPQVLHGL